MDMILLIIYLIQLIYVIIVKIIIYQMLLVVERVDLNHVLNNNVFNILMNYNVIK